MGKKVKWASVCQTVEKGREIKKCMGFSLVGEIVKHISPMSPHHAV